MILTPFEKAVRNKVLHPKRMALCHKVTEMIEQLEEAEKFLAVYDDLKEHGVNIEMYDPELIETVRKEVNMLMTTLSVVATTWEQMEGVNA